MRIWRSAVWLLAAALGCASPVEVTTETAPDARFPSYASYRQMPAPIPDSEIPRYTPEIGERMQAEIDGILQDKGYRPAEAGSAELVVGFILTGVAERRWVNASDPDTDFWIPEDYTDGTLVINVLDAEGRRVWQGIGRTEIVTSGALITDSPQRTALAVVRDVLERFPAANDAADTAAP